MKIMSVVGARPNFMKIAPFVRALEKHNNKVNISGGITLEHYLVHTGQHYDSSLSASFFETLNIPSPNIDLEIGSGTHAEQVGRTMIEFEKVVKNQKPDWVVVVGDVNATCACSITAKKEQVKLAHIESGLRSFDMSMPEEINRMVTDRLSDILFTTDEFADKNLIDEGVTQDKIKRVGNIMIDTLLDHKQQAESKSISDIISINRIPESQSVYGHLNDFAVVTLHRPSNVDEKTVFSRIVKLLADSVCKEMSVIWPVHPRTMHRLKEYDLFESLLVQRNLILLKPIDYLDLLKLNIHANVVLTDSGGVQEECCVLGTPCLTLRWNTERPVTLREYGGVNILVGNDVERIKKGFDQLKNLSKRPFAPQYWDGLTAERIVNTLVEQTK